jgi:hypothetical protein
VDRSRVDAGEFGGIALNETDRGLLGPHPGGMIPER